MKWLDVPDGDVAKGDPDFVVGHIRRHRDIPAMSHPDPIEEASDD